MNRRIELHICMTLVNILLLSVSQCLAFPKMGRREIAHIEGQTERRTIDDLEKPRPSKQTAQIALIEDSNIVLTELSGTSLNKGFTVGEETPLTGASNVFTYSQSTDVCTPTESMASSDERGFNPSERNKGLSESRLTTAVTTVVSLNTNMKADVFSSFSSMPTVEKATEAGQSFPRPLDDRFSDTGSKESDSREHLKTTQLNTEEMLTTNPQTRNLETTTEHTTVSSVINPTAEIGTDILTSNRESPSQVTAHQPQATVTEHLLDSLEYFPNTESETGSMLAGVVMAASAPTATLGISTVLAMNEDWDDTKIASASRIGVSESRDNAGTMYVEAKAPQTLQSDHDDVKGRDPLTDFADVVMGQVGERTHTGTSPVMVFVEEKSVAFTDQSSFPFMNSKEDTKGTTISLFQNTRHPKLDDREHEALFFAVTTVPLTDSQSETYYPLGNTLADSIAQEMMPSQDGGITMSSVTQEQDSTLEITRKSGETDERNKSPSSPSITVISSMTQLPTKSEYLATTVSTTAMPLSQGVTPALTVTKSKEETSPPAFDSSVTLPGMMEETMDISLKSASVPSTIRTIQSSIRHISTSVTYDLEQMESQEGEEDEDEEVGKEEEEEEEDKDEDSLDESMEGDTELPGFTLPGISSQEPRLDRGNLEPLEGVSYQVPDAIEWEQQNQGLVRSWMEKLKDKAGYMSGMLVPVGVGIAGALFILAALYSIKIMNRRRRNGFKRHKRKQREFNSMQDRVMLLADSSEDEF